jgi:hypothetical protein
MAFVAYRAKFDSVQGSGGRSRWRIGVVLAGTIASLALAGTVFWHEDARYSRPTPRPEGLIQPARGERLPVERWLGDARVPAGQPVLLHFFNPYCPCSRFNLDHVRELRHEFGARVAFVGVIQATVQDESERKDIERRLADLGFDLPYVVDVSGTIAKEAGVYSTPQGVLVDDHAALVYRGNYNVSRYCTDRRTQFVRLALESLVGSGVSMPPDTPAYGCQLPSATNDGVPGRWASLAW